MRVFDSSALLALIFDETGAAKVEALLAGDDNMVGAANLSEVLAKLVDQGMSDAEVEAAARAARCDHFIHTLAGGYDFMINEEGTNLSQGQRQLVTIARAILADRPALILDEATSNVDTRTEELIQRAMDALMQGRTSFVIAHRLSTIRNADVILVIRDGDIVEKGTHDELLAQGGFYADLYNSQFDEAA